MLLIINLEIKKDFQDLKNNNFNNNNAILNKNKFIISNLYNLVYLI